MARYLLFAFTCLGFVAPARSQSFLTPGAIWVIDVFSVRTLPSVAPEFFQVIEDTVVAGETFRRIEVSRVVLGENAASTGIAIREDNAGRVFMTRGGRSGLVYDFGLRVGDSIRPFNPRFPESSCAFSVVAIGDTSLSDGITRRTYRLNAREGYTRGATVIEGIGSSFEGLFGPVCLAPPDDEVSSELLCFLTQERSPIYPDGDSQCIYIRFANSVGEVREASNTEIYPNPFYDRIDVVLSRAIGGHLTLFDVCGRVIYANGISSSEVTISTTNLSAGTYFIVIVGASGERIMKRLTRL